MLFAMLESSSGESGISRFAPIRGLGIVMEAIRGRDKNGPTQKPARRCLLKQRCPATTNRDTGCECGVPLALRSQCLRNKFTDSSMQSMIIGRRGVGGTGRP